jgi:hypothetical protein
VAEQLYRSLLDHFRDQVKLTEDARAAHHTVSGLLVRGTVSEDRYVDVRGQAIQLMRRHALLG